MPRSRSFHVTTATCHLLVYHTERQVVGYRIAYICACLLTRRGQRALVALAAIEPSSSPCPAGPGSPSMHAHVVTRCMHMLLQDACTCCYKMHAHVVTRCMHVLLQDACTCCYKMQRTPLAAVAVVDGCYMAGSQIFIGRDAPHSSTLLCTLSAITPNYVSCVLTLHAWTFQV